MTYPDTCVIQDLEHMAYGDARPYKHLNASQPVLKKLGNQGKTLYNTYALNTCLCRYAEKTDNVHCMHNVIFVRYREFVRFFAYSRYFLSPAALPLA